VISENTVLILGAGASAPYGFPTGSELRSEILKLRIEDYETIRKSEKPTLKLLNIKNLYNPLKAEEFKSKLRNTDQDTTIDAFLSNHIEFRDIGKFSIVSVLIKCEQEGVLFNPPNEGSWYHTLFKFLNSDKNNFKNNKLSIITFNYDRSLEMYFWKKFKDLNICNNDAVENIKSIPIIHVYGILGQLPFLVDNNEVARHYNTAESNKVIRACMDSIKIIYEDLDIDKYFKSAYKLLEDAKIVIFLGFGYHKENLERLKIRETLNRTDLRKQRLLLEMNAQAEVLRAQRKGRAYDSAINREKTKIQTGVILPVQLLRLPPEIYDVIAELVRRRFLDKNRYVELLPALTANAVEGLKEVGKRLQEDRFRTAGFTLEQRRLENEYVYQINRNLESIANAAGKLGTFEAS